MLSNQDINGWDTSNVTDMSDMFSGADAFNQDLDGWNTSNVTTMHGMFGSTDTFNSDIDGWSSAVMSGIWLVHVLPMLN